MPKRPPSNLGAWATSVLVVIYAGFVQWIWGWRYIFQGWQDVGISTVAIALSLLVSTYFLRAHRMQDYFPAETKGRFLRLFRVAQIHNLLNIMLPFRAGETSFPLLMRSEFGVPLARGTAALLVLRLLDLHALLAAAGGGLVLGSGHKPWAAIAWTVFLFSPLLLFPLHVPILALLRSRLPSSISGDIDQFANGLPASLSALTRAWLVTVLNWAVKIFVLAWVLGLLGVVPTAATFGGALGGEISSILPVHAPGGIGTYPAGIVAGAVAIGAIGEASPLGVLAKASINVHLLMIASALIGAAVSLVLQSVWPGPAKQAS